MPGKYFVELGDTVEGFDKKADADAFIKEQKGARYVSPADAKYYQNQADAESWKGAATAVASNAGFGAGKLAVSAFGSPDLQQQVAMSNAANPWWGVLGSFIAPWGAASKAASGLARGLVGAGEALEAGSIFGRGASIFGEGSALGEQAAARGASELAAGEAAARSAAPLAEEAANLARPGFAQEASALAGRGLTPEAAAILEAHPQSFLEAAIREGSLNAGVGALNSAGDFLLSEKYMGGDPHADAGTLSQAILSGALSGGLLGGAAGVLTHGAGKAVDALFNPAHAPKFRVPESKVAELAESYVRGGMSREEAALAAKSALEHGIAATKVDGSYNALSQYLEHARVKRAIERGEIELPPVLTGEGALREFVEQTTLKAHGIRSGTFTPTPTAELLGAVEGDVANAARERRAAFVAEARAAQSPEAAAVWKANPYKGELVSAIAEAEALEAPEVVKLLEKADGLLSKSKESPIARFQALALMDQAMAHAPPGFHLDGERAVLSVPLEHQANGPKFLSALGEHQLAEKARRDLGALIGAAEKGGHLSQEAVAGIEGSLKELGLKGGRLDRALVEHYQNEAAQAIAAEAKKAGPTLGMLGGLFAGGLASKIVGGLGGGAVGLKVAQTLGQAVLDPIAASGSIRKAVTMINHGAADIDRLVQGLGVASAPKASLMNVIENMTPWGKVLWDTAPGRTARAVGQTLEDGFRALAPSMPQRAAAGLQVAHSIEQHLQEHEPQPVIPKNVNPAALANLPPRYNEREVAIYQTRLQAVANPKAVIAQFFATGELTPEAADTLRATHPFLVRDVIAKGAAQMAQAPESQRYAMARQLEVLAGPGGGYFSASSTPAFTAAVQKSYAQFAPQGPGPGGPTGNASPQKDPGPGGAQFAPVSVTRNMNGKFLQTTHASPSGALSTNLGSQ